MTVVCGGGASAPKPGVEQIIVLSAASIEAGLVGFGFPEVAAVLAPLFITAPYNTTDFCGSDPPADPGVGPTDVFNALQTGDFTAAASAISKLQQWFDHQYWYSICQCSSGPTPAPAAPSNPGPIGNSPGLPTGTTAGSCWDVTYNITTPSGGCTADHYCSWLSPLMPGTGVNPPWGGTTQNVIAVPVPPGTVDIFGTYTRTDTNGVLTAPSGLHMSFFDSGKNWILSDYISNGDPSGVFGRAFPANPGYVALWTYSTPGDPVYSVTVRLQISCTSGTGALEVPCCPPDPTLSALLQRVLASEAATQQLVTLLQRYLLPFAYVDGSTHAGITGTGSFGVSRLVGMRAVVTPPPGTPRQSLGEPPYVWDMGWMSVLNGDGMIDEIRITRQNQVWMSRLFPTAVTFGYALQPGVSVSFTELEPEA